MRSRVGATIVTLLVAVLLLIALGSVGGIGPVELGLWLAITVVALALVVRSRQRPGEP